MNKRLLNYISVLLLAMLPKLAISCGFISGLFTSEEVPLEYAGTIKLGTPQKDGKSIQIPITFQGGKWLENSGIGFKQFNVAQSENNIYITVVTCLASGGSNPPQPIIKLQNTEPGLYQVIYKNPDGTNVQLNKIEI